MQIAHKLTSIKIEIDAIIRILNDNNKKVKTTQLEQLIIRQSELLDAALNRRVQYCGECGYQPPCIYGKCQNK